MRTLKNGVKSLRHLALKRAVSKYLQKNASKHRERTHTDPTLSTYISAHTKEASQTVSGVQANYPVNINSTETIPQLNTDQSPTAAREQATNRATPGETRQNPKTAGSPNPEVTAETSGGEIKTEETTNAHPHKTQRTEVALSESKSCHGQPRSHWRHEKRSRGTDTEQSRKRQKKRRRGKAAARREHNPQRNLT